MSMTESALLKALRQNGGLKLEAIIKVCLETQGKEYSLVSRNWEYPSAARTLKALKARGLIRFNRARQLWIVTDPDPEAARAGPAAPSPPELSAEERVELERLSAEMERGLAEDGGNWPVYTGPGE